MSDDRTAGHDVEGAQPCPCGKIPTSLWLMENGQGYKWAQVSGDCCGEWSIEYRTDYKPLDSEDGKQLALDAWNLAPRATTEHKEVPPKNE